MELEFTTKHTINVRPNGIKIFFDSNILHGKYADYLIESKKLKNKKLIKEENNFNDDFNDDITTDDIIAINNDNDEENDLAGIGGEMDEKDIEMDTGLEDKDKLEIIKKFIKPLIDGISDKVVGNGKMSKVTVDDEELSVDIDIDDVSIDDLMKIVEVATAILDEITLEVVGEGEEEEEEEENKEELETEGTEPGLDEKPEDNEKSEDSHIEAKLEGEDKIKKPEEPIKPETECTGDLTECDKDITESTQHKFSNVYYEDNMITVITSNLVKQYLKAQK